MIDIIIGILAFVFVLGIIVCIHEGGHFFFARRANILCREFAFGMGPQLIKKKKGETVYALRAFPIGGFCAIAGEEVENDPLNEVKTVKLLIENDIVKKIYINIDNDLYDDIPTFDIVNHDLFDAENTGNLFITVATSEGEKTYAVDPQAMYVFTKKINEKAKVATILEKDIEENVTTLVEKLNLKNKEKILNLNWNKTQKSNNVFSNLSEETEEIVIIISGEKEFIKNKNEKLERYIQTHRIKQKIRIINCYEIIDFNGSINEILNEHDKILNTSGEKEISEVFENYEQKKEVI